MGQLMMAIFDENPQAFSEQNINLLRSGVTLTVPEAASVQNLNAELAVQDSLTQVQSYRDTVLAQGANTELLTGLPSQSEVKSPYTVEPGVTMVTANQLDEIEAALEQEQTEIISRPSNAPALPPEEDHAAVVRYSYDAAYVYDDNIRLAQNSDDIRDDSIFSATLKARVGKEIDSFSLLSYGADIGYEGFARFDELSHASFSVNARYRFALASGFSSPIYTLGIKLGGREFDSEMRDATDASLSADLNRWLTNRLNMTIGLGYRVSDSKSRAFDTEQVRLFGNLDLNYSKTGLLYGTYAYATGDIVSSASPTLDIINAAEEIEPDDAFGGIEFNQFAYRLEADTHVITVGYNEIITRGTSFDVSLRYVDSDASGDIGYERALLRVSLLGRF